MCGWVTSSMVPDQAAFDQVTESRPLPQSGLFQASESMSGPQMPSMRPALTVLASPPEPKPSISRLTTAPGRSSAPTAATRAAMASVRALNFQRKYRPLISMKPTKAPRENVRISAMVSTPMVTTSVLFSAWLLVSPQVKSSSA